MRCRHANIVRCAVAKHACHAHLQCMAPSAQTCMCCPDRVSEQLATVSYATISAKDCLQASTVTVMQHSSGCDE